MTGSATRNLEALQALYGGGDYSPGVVIISTHWTKKDEDRRQNEEEERVMQFSESFWKSNGARTDRLEYHSSGVPFDGNSIDSHEARRILHTILKQPEHDIRKRVL
jgi:hypothetical protein